MNSSSIPTNKVDNAHNDSIWSAAFIPTQGMKENVIHFMFKLIL